MALTEEGRKGRNQAGSGKAGRTWVAKRQTMVPVSKSTREENRAESSTITCMMLITLPPAQNYLARWSYRNWKTRYVRGKGRRLVPGLPLIIVWPEVNR